MSYTLDDQLRALDAARDAKDSDAVAAILRQMEIAGNQPHLVPGAINMERGADIGTRLAVGNAPNKDKLGAMRVRYPDAMPYGEDNFVYYNRETGQPQIYNPEGFDSGDLVGAGRLGANIIGGIGGFWAGTPTSPLGQLATTSGGATLAGLGYDEVVEGIYGTPDTRSAGEQVFDASTEFLFGLIPFDKGLKFARDKISPWLREKMVRGSEAVIDVANKYGINPTTGTIGNKMIQNVDAATQKLMFSVDRWQQSADEMMEGVGGMIETFFRSTGGRVDPEAAGNQLVNKAKTYMDNFRATSSAMYDDVDNYIPADARVPALQFNNFLKEYGGRFAGDPDIAKLLKSPMLMDMAENSGETIGYQTLKELRTLIGNKLDDGDTIGDLASADMKRVYAALTQDLFDGAADFGPDALAAATKANDFYKQGMVVVEEIIEPNMMIGGKWATGSETFKNFKRLVGDTEKLERLQGSGVVDADDLSAGGAALLEDLGRATKGAQNAEGTRISPSRIISQTDDRVISKDAQEILFNKDSREILQDLRVFSEATRGVDSFVNNSNTASATYAQQMIGGGGLVTAVFEPVSGLATLVGTVGIPYLTSKGLQSQWLKDWMMKAPREATEEAITTWKDAGMRIAIANQAGNFFEALMMAQPDLTRSEVPENRGALQE